ncbi:hypothetical protein FHY19_004186 [Xanthomonas arboricola]|nr:hypothetical protein [Xanthomonas sp. 4461]
MHNDRAADAARFRFEVCRWVAQLQEVASYEGFGLRRTHTRMGVTK